MKYLSREDIEIISRKITDAYRDLPQNRGKTLYCVDPDVIISDVLGLSVEYHHLSPDRRVLGLTTSCRNVEYRVFDDPCKTEYCVIDRSTIFIEKDLENNMYQKGRCNFTKAHEAGHQILMRMFPDSYGSPEKKFHFCMSREVTKRRFSWEEWQANALASALLMPQDILNRALFCFGFKDRVDIINRDDAPIEYERFCMTAEMLGVSRTALSIRLGHLGLVKINDFGRPYISKRKRDRKVNIDIYKEEDKWQSLM